MALASPRRPSLALVRAPRARARAFPVPPTFQAREQGKRKKEEDDEGITLSEDSWDDSEEIGVIKIYTSPMKKRTKVVKEEVIDGLAEMLEKSVIEENNRKREIDLVKEIDKLALGELASNEGIKVPNVKKQQEKVEERILEVRKRIAKWKSRRPTRSNSSGYDLNMAMKENVGTIAKSALKSKSTSSLMARRAKCVRFSCGDGVLEIRPPPSDRPTNIRI